MWKCCQCRATTQRAVVFNKGVDTIAYVMTQEISPVKVIIDLTSCDCINHENSSNTRPSFKIDTRLVEIPIIMTV